MSSKDDKLIDAELTEPYLRGGSKYSALYSEIETDEVPSALDNAVIGEAAAAIKPRKGFVWKRYTPMIAVAATAVLTVSVVLRSGLHLSNQSPEQTLTEETTVNVETRVLGNISSSEIAEQPAAEPSVEAKALQDRSKQETAASSQSARPMSPAKAPAPPPPKADAPAKKEFDELVVRGDAIRRTPEEAAFPVEVITTEEVQRQGAPSNLQIQSRNEFANAGPRGTIPVEKTKAVDKRAVEMEQVQMAQASQANRMVPGPRAVPAAPAVTRSDQVDATIRQLNPGSWLAYIRELRIAGKTLEADKEWEKFVEANPTYRVDEKDAARPNKR